jgi:hypothetical protein
MVAEYCTTYCNIIRPMMIQQATLKIFSYRLELFDKIAAYTKIKEA